MSTDKQNTNCSCCGLERSNLHVYAELGMQLCDYCELLPLSVIKQEQVNPNQDSLFTVMSRMLGRLEQRVLQQDPSIPLRTPLHDKALALVMAMGNSKMCPNCHTINACTCSTGGVQTARMITPKFWPYTDAQAILAEIERITGAKS